MEYMHLEEIIDFHDCLIEKYGGCQGIRDIGLLSSAIAIPHQQFDGIELHKTLHEKAAAYMYHVIKNHPFVDGNKRTGTFCCLIFLKRNNASIIYDSNLLENLAISIAENTVNKTDLALILSHSQQLKLSTENL